MPGAYKSRADLRAAREERQGRKPKRAAAPEPPSPSKPERPPAGGEAPGAGDGRGRRASFALGYATALSAAPYVIRAELGGWERYLAAPLAAGGVFAFGAWRGSRQKREAEESACLIRGLGGAAWLAVTTVIPFGGLWGVAAGALPAAGAALACRPPKDPAQAPGEKEDGERLAITAAPAAAAPAAEDPKVTRLREKILTGPLAAAVSGYLPLGDPPGSEGWQVSVTFPADGDGTVTALRAPAVILAIARLYATVPDRVTVGYAAGDDPAARSELEAVLTVTRVRIRTAATARRWDPRASTFDPAHGTVEFGDFPDRPMRWQSIRRPTGGAVGGVLSGDPRQGKTTAMHILASQMGLAVEDGSRLFGLLMADPQKMPLAAWRGRADVSAVGTAASLRLLRMGAAISRSRADWMGGAAWTDAKGRVRHGRGYWPTGPRHPVVAVFVDELLMVVSPERGDDAVEALNLIELLIMEAPKTGVFPVLAMPDSGARVLRRPEIRDKLARWNALAFYAEADAADRLGVEGNPQTLTDPGSAYFGGIDRMSGTVGRIRWLEEDSATEVDVADLAAAVSEIPIQWDYGFMRVMDGEYGWPGSGWTFGDDDEPAAPPAPPAGTPAREAVAGMSAARQEVTDYLVTAGCPVPLERIAADTGLPYGTVQSAAIILAHNGILRQEGDMWTARPVRAA
jgi:hypothetical protein